MRLLIALLATASLVIACAGGSNEPAKPTAADAAAFLEDVDTNLLALGIDTNQAGWVQQNFITADTEALNAKSNKAFIEAVAKYAKDATRFEGLDLPADQRRQINLLRLSLVMAAPTDQKEATELTTIAARMDGAYGRGKWCPASAGSFRLRQGYGGQVGGQARSEERQELPRYRADHRHHGDQPRPKAAP